MDNLFFKRCSFFLLFCFGCFFCYSEEPWGKDACLIKSTANKSSYDRCSTPIIGAFGEAAIRFHQEVISPADGPRSHFIPSSSQYTLNAMRKYGFFKGFLLGCDRLMRENSDEWVYRKTKNPVGEIMKYDPVR